MKSKALSKKASDLPVMKAIWKSCPFRIVEGTRHLQDTYTATKVIVRCLEGKAEQICHSTQGENREFYHRCKGFFDWKSDIGSRLVKK
jgi:hypothetical protein